MDSPEYWGVSMRKILSAALAATLAAADASAQADHFTFTDTLTDNHGGLHSITGTFDGTLNGNLITDLANPNVFVDGSAFPNNGHLFVFSISADFSAWEQNAVASLDGQHNNFTFADNDFYNNNFTTGEGDTYQSILGISAAIIDQHNQVFAGGDATRFRAQLVGGPVPEPASWALMVAGFGMAGLGLRSRRQTVRFIA
jgi:hypothetical protein